jgi:hypothetical protein
VSCAVSANASSNGVASVMKRNKSLRIFFSETL